MSNMSYCRFTNTSGDLEACLDAICREERLSDFEIAAGKSMFRRFLSFCRDYDIISGYDDEAMESMFDTLAKEGT